MNRLRNQAEFRGAGYRRRKSLGALGIMLLVVCGITAGCANKDTTSQAVTSATKPTSAQEAAMRRGMQQGPAIAAAQRAHQGN